MSIHSISKHIKSQFRQTYSVTDVHCGTTAELHNPTLSHSERLDIVYREAERLGQAVYVDPHYCDLTKTWSYKIGLESAGQKTLLYKSGLLQDDALNPYAAFCAGQVAHAQSRYMETHRDEFSLDRLTTACVNTMADQRDRPALQAALDDPRYCSANFAGWVQPKKPGDRFIALFKSSPEKTHPDLQLYLSNRMATCGEFRGETLKQALQTGDYASLRDMIARTHGTSADPGLKKFGALMKLEIDDMCGGRTPTYGELQQVLEVLDRCQIGKTTAGELCYPAEQYPRAIREHPGKRERFKAALGKVRLPLFCPVNRR